MRPVRSYCRASPSPARHRPGARSARRDGCRCPLPPTAALGETDHEFTPCSLGGDRSSPDLAYRSKDTPLPRSLLRLVGCREEHKPCGSKVLGYFCASPLCDHE
jgi:hypothetical protein